MQHIHLSKKNLLIVVFCSITLIEILIFAVAFSVSNHQPIIRIVDKNNQVLNASQARTFSIFKIYLFEKKYGALENYRIDIEKKEPVFPFRTWFFAAICIPIALVFVITFILKLFISKRS